MKYVLENPVVGRADTEKFSAHIRWRNGVLITDEPEKLGGKDTGPDPYTLLLASLVSCTLATLRMYIDHKGLDIPGIVIEANLFHRLEREGPVVHIERRISLDHLQDTEVRDKLLQVAENCPISKMLKGDIRIMTAFQDPAADTMGNEVNLDANAA